MKYTAIFCIVLFILFQGCATKKSALSGPDLPSKNEGRSFRLLTYNVLTGFQKNPQQADRFVEWIRNKNFDVVAFQELSTFTQDSLERLARRYGHNYAVLHKGNGSPVGITSRYPLTNVEKMTGTMHHGCIYARSAGFHFFVTHLSPFSYEKCVEEMKGILDKAAVIPSTEKVLILGDLNSFSPEDSTSYTQKRRYGVVQSLLDSGYSDTYRQVHHRFENSFPTMAYAHKAKTTTRIDYVFAGKTAAKYINGAEIIKDSVTSALSDHYPLMVIFK